MTRISKTSSDPRAVHSKIFQFSEGKNPLEATITPDRPAVQRERGLRECPLLRKQRTLKVRSLKPAFDPNRPSSLFSSVYGLATTRQHSCNGKLRDFGHGGNVRPDYRCHSQWRRDYSLIKPDLRFSHS